MRWISLAALSYILVGLGFYSYGFRIFKKLHEFSSRFKSGRLKDRLDGTAPVFDQPNSRSLVIFFRGLGIFLVLAGVAFFLLMMHPSMARR